MNNLTIHSVSGRKDLKILWIHKSKRKRRLSYYRYGTKRSNRLHDQGNLFCIYAKTLPVQGRYTRETLYSIMTDICNYCPISSIFNHLSCYVKEEE